MLLLVYHTQNEMKIGSLKEQDYQVVHLFGIWQIDGAATFSSAHHLRPYSGESNYSHWICDLVVLFFCDYFE